MKTAMQELIDKIKQFKYSEINEQAWGAYDDVMDIAESLLEKEKEQIMDAYMEGGDWESLPQPRFENYYNANFKTKEK